MEMSIKKVKLIVQFMFILSDNNKSDTDIVVLKKFSNAKITAMWLANY